MLQDLQKQVERQLSLSNEPMRQWAGSVALAIAVAIAYFLAARLSFFLKTKPDDVAVFWPAAGVAAGVLIALGPATRLPVAVGTMVASIPANLLGNWSLRTSIVFALCNAGQVLLMAGLIERYFGSAFSLHSVRQVLGLVAAAIVGTAAAAIGGTVGVVLVEGSTAPALTIWYHWLASNVPGIVAVAPLLIGLVSAVRDPPPRSEIIESAVALVALTALSGLTIFLPREPWVIVALVAVLFPLLLWLAARSRPVFAAAAAFIVALTIVWTTTFSIGMFDEKNFTIAERARAAQAAVLAVSLCAIVLASLFAERRESEARLALSNMMLLRAVSAQCREREARLMTGDAVSASIAHEIKQPLSGMTTGAYAALRWLDRTTPDLDEAKAALKLIVADGRRAGAVIDGIRANFKKDAGNRTSLDVNELIGAALALTRGDLQRHRILAQAEPNARAPRVRGDRIQLQQVLLNLITNAIDSMAAKDGARVLCVRSELDDGGGVVVSVADTGTGIGSQELERIFNPLFTTKSGGMGMGLWICRSIIEAHSGRLWVAPNKPEGAIFQFRLLSDGATVAEGS